MGENDIRKFTTGVDLFEQSGVLIRISSLSKIQKIIKKKEEFYLVIKNDLKFDLILKWTNDLGEIVIYESISPGMIIDQSTTTNNGEWLLTNTDRSKKIQMK